MKTITGVLLLAAGFSLFLLLFLNASRTDAVIEVSFVLLAGEKYEPYENGTYHHTRVFTKSSLKGEVTVQGEEISFTANGYNTQHLKNISMSQNSSFHKSC